MHRNTLILIVILGIFAALVVVVNIGKKPQQISQQNIDPTPKVSSKMLPDSACGISFEYPENLKKIDIGTGGMTLVNTEKNGETIVVVCQKDIPRVPLPKDKMEPFAIGSTSATLYHDASQKDGSPVDKLIFTHPT